MDYSVNIRAVLSSFCVGTGGLDVGLINSAQGIAGGENWEKSFTRHSPDICRAILRVVARSIKEALTEEITLTISAKLREQHYTESEVVSLTQKYFKGEKTGVDEVDNVRISISFDMG
jgi:hypothetical protein